MHTGVRGNRVNATAAVGRGSAEDFRHVLSKDCTDRYTDCPKERRVEEISGYRPFPWEDNVLRTAKQWYCLEGFIEETSERACMELTERQNTIL